jgi:hypothetical protein
MESEAAQRGIRVTQVAEERLNLGIRFVPEVQSFIDRYAKGLNFTHAQLLESIVVDYMARNDARKAVWPKRERLMLEFIRTESGPYRGQQLYAFLLDRYKDEYEKEREKLFLEKLARYEAHNFGEERIKQLYSEFGYSYEKMMELQKKQAEIDDCIKKVVDKGWINEELYDHAHDVVIYELCKMHKRGTLTEDELQEEIENHLQDDEKGELLK